MNCKNCKHWSPGINYYYPNNLGVGTCLRVGLFSNSTKWEATETSEKMVFNDDAKDDKAFVQDAEAHSADLITMPDFGCVQFEPQ